MMRAALGELVAEGKRFTTTKDAWGMVIKRLGHNDSTPPGFSYKTFARECGDLLDLSNSQI